MEGTNCNCFFATYIAFSIVIEGAIGNASANVKREYLKDTNIYKCCLHKKYMYVHDIVCMCRSHNRLKYLARNWHITLHLGLLQDNLASNFS